VSSRAALWWLTLASLVFYGAWNPAWVPLLVGSMVFNFGAARAIAAGATEQGRRVLLAVTVGGDLALLGYYKYAGFGAGVMAVVTGLDIRWNGPELPLGISFFTFTQIAFLVDVHRRRAADFSAVRYGLFVTYYPHLVAGPILHHAEMMPQFARPDVLRFDPARLADGLAVFILGLFKKTVLGDAFGGYAAPAFAAASHHTLTFFEAWGAALSYTLQIYFDFSGYSDMAIGLALMMGVHLPANFDSPYKARNIAEFWRRWHMTLSRFLRDYLYIPLGGNRRGRLRQQANLMVTMLLGGLWHGAGWTFLAWGGLHGAYLAIHHGWRRWRDRAGGPARPRAGLLRSAAGWLATFLAVVIAWVFFRATDLGAAMSMLRAMAGLHGAMLPDQVLDAAPVLRHLASGAGKVAYLADGSVMGFVEMAWMLGLGLAIVLAGRSLPELPWRWRYALVVPCAALALQRVFFGPPSEFLYFRF
jgi:D-alanyl-lipoteichoic acid acyltransferase DltB (MBOAT superfamily)